MNRVNKRKMNGQKMEAFLLKFAITAKPFHVPIITTFILSVRNPTTLYKTKR
jgi:hypothetical protein